MVGGLCVQIPLLAIEVGKTPTGQYGGMVGGGGGCFSTLKQKSIKGTI